MPVPVPVPETHVRAALEAIHNTLDACQKESTEATLSKTNSTRLNQLSNQIFQQINNILTDQIVTAVQPIPLAEYTSKYVPFPSPVRRKMMNHEESDDEYTSEDDETPVKQKDENMKEDELEEEDLLDQEALAQAQTLRAKVRQAAMRNRDLAEGYLQRITTLIHAEEEASRQLLILPSQSTKEMLTDPSISGELHDYVVSLGANLTQLQQDLNQIKSYIPDRREALQSTIDTVDYYMEKQKQQQQQQQQPDQVLSQELPRSGVENAITSRDNEGLPRWKSMQEMKDTSLTQERPAWKDKSAESRLALFLTNYP